MTNQKTNATRFGRKGRRGVSPIIATILLVAITVVLAAVLYILITGLTTTSSKPYSLGFGQGSPTTLTNGGYSDTFSVSATSGLTTSLFGLSISSATGSSVASINESTCATESVCKAIAGGWYAVLVNSGGSVLAEYPTTAAGTSWTSTQAISASDSIVVFNSASQLSGSADTLSAFGTGSSTVSGSTTM